MTGHLLNIERLAVHDGPGIRTTVFLKGCPLRCRWCHNPESVAPEPELGFLASQCVGCQACADVCPNGVHTFVDGEHRLERTHCTACGRCVEACLPGALELHGREVDVAEVVAAVLEDRTFYAQSGGGCTISGGEPLLQAEFCGAVFERLHREGIHCALDTSGAVAWSAFETVLPHTDLVLYDLKQTDAARHREHTGLSNELILDNLARLAEHGVPVEVRVPFVPGVNTDEASVTALADLLAGLPNLTGVRLLPYHLARSKYAAVGHADTLPDVPPPPAATVAAAAAILRARGVLVLG